MERSLRQGLVRFRSGHGRGQLLLHPAFQAAAGSATYLEGGLDIPIPFEFTLSGRVGRQNIQRNVNFGWPDYTTWNVSLAREIIGFTLAGGYSDTNVKRGAQLGNNTPIAGDSYSIARGQFFFSVSRKF
jgi:hypothetical protein